MNKTDNILEVKASAKYLRSSPLKVRRVLDQIRGKSYKEAMMMLEFMPYRCCQPIFKLLKSAASNAEHNNGLEKKDLSLVTKAYANEGPVMKRFRPRAQGRAFKIYKPTCHISIYVGTQQ
uniref:ribosomal protein L22 n=1 Tax=Madagascaria erythrocladioides TaxID=753684 RepID=UPI001FCCD423|nr:ribosomal protein L22 [Madagascaria erythrocladioides]UNJ16575.1 ribosomal protein L22 [Madagascaria erythrocladioides]